MAVEEKRLMEDITGLGKVAESVAKLGDSKLPNKAYDDLLTAPLQETGKGLTDLVKVFRLFLAPIQLLAVAQDRLAGFCDRVRTKVPEDRQQEATPSIALPVLMDLRFMEDDNPLTELYLNLLARSIDKERCNEAHPAFVKIIEQLSPDEAMVLYVLRDAMVRVDFTRGNDTGPPILISGFTRVATTNFPLDRIVYPEKVWMYLDRLEASALITYRFRVPSLDIIASDEFHDYRLTDFGRMFVRACIPENFDLSHLKSKINQV
jgi:hypothetical protein